MPRSLSVNGATLCPAADRRSGAAFDDSSGTVYREGVIQSFGDPATEDLFHGRDSRAARRLPRAIWPIIRRKLDMVNAAHTVGDLRAPPGNRLEALKGEQAGSYSVRVNDQYRITFRFEDGNASGVTCEDYH